MLSGPCFSPLLRFFAGPDKSVLFLVLLGGFISDAHITPVGVSLSTFSRAKVAFLLGLLDVAAACYHRRTSNGSEAFLLYNVLAGTGDDPLGSIEPIKPDPTRPCRICSGLERTLDSGLVLSLRPRANLLNRSLEGLSFLGAGLRRFRAAAANSLRFLASLLCSFDP